MVDATLTLDRYYRLPPDVRAEVDAWAEREGLYERFSITDIVAVGEGYVDLCVYAVDDLGMWVLDDDDSVKREVTRATVRTPPPLAALDLLPPPVVEEEKTNDG